MRKTKRQLASALLLSTTAIGAAASGTTNADFKNFFNDIRSSTSKIGLQPTDTQLKIIIPTTFGLFSTLCYSAYKVIKQKFSKIDEIEVANETISWLKNVIENQKSFKEEKELKFLKDLNKKLEKISEQLINIQGLSGLNKNSNSKKQIKNSAKKSLEKLKSHIRDLEIQHINIVDKKKYKKVNYLKIDHEVFEQIKIVDKKLPDIVSRKQEDSYSFRELWSLLINTQLTKAIRQIENIINK